MNREKNFIVCFLVFVFVICACHQSQSSNHFRTELFPSPLKRSSKLWINLSSAGRNSQHGQKISFVQKVWNFINYGNMNSISREAISKSTTVLYDDEPTFVQAFPVLVAAAAVAIAVGVGVPTSSADNRENPLDEFDLDDIVNFQNGLDRSQIPENNLKIPVVGVSFQDDGCSDNSIRFGNGECYPVLKRGPCHDPHSWVTVDPVQLQVCCNDSILF